MPCEHGKQVKEVCSECNPPLTIPAAVSERLMLLASVTAHILGLQGRGAKFFEPFGAGGFNYVLSSLHARVFLNFVPDPSRLESIPLVELIYGEVILPAPNLRNQEAMDRATTQLQEFILDQIKPEVVATRNGAGAG